MQWKTRPNILTHWQVFTVPEKNVLRGKVNAVIGQVNALSFPEGFSLIWAGGFLCSILISKLLGCSKRLNEI